MFFFAESEVTRKTHLALILTPAECASMKAMDFLCHVTGMLAGSVMTRCGYDTSLMGKRSAYAFGTAAAAMRISSSLERGISMTSTLCLYYYMHPHIYARALAYDMGIIRMSTPYMAFSSLLRNALAVFFSLWLATFLIVRAYAMHEAYIAEVGRRSDEKWLLNQCQDPDFYANLRQHSNLCTEVCSFCASSMPAEINPYE